MSKESWKELGRKGYLERNVEALRFCLQPQIKTRIINHLGDSDQKITQTLDELTSKGFLTCIKPHENARYRISYQTTRAGRLVLTKWNRLMEAFKNLEL
jgi:DNA-binding PadR family transcriptional regulator